MKSENRRLAEDWLNLCLTILKIVREVMLILSMAINYSGPRQWLICHAPFGCTNSY